MDYTSLIKLCQAICQMYQRLYQGATSGMTSIRMFLASGVLTCIVKLIETRFPTVSMVKAMYGEAGDDIFV